MNAHFPHRCRLRRLGPLVVSAALLLSACVGIEQAPVQPTIDTETGDASALIKVTYQCAADTTVVAVFDNENDTVSVTLPDETLDLPHVQSGSGAKYSDGSTTFWTKGDEAFVQVDEEIVIEDCQA